MQTKFLNGFMILICPDRIFKNAVKKEAAFEVIISLFVTTLVMTPGLMNLFKIVRIPTFTINGSTLLLIMLSTFCVFILISAVMSWFFNWLYSLAIERRAGLVTSNFTGSFICHMYVIPYWALLGTLHSILSGKSIEVWWVLVSVLFAIRLLDIEARLIKVVYRMRLIKGYAVVLAQLLLIGLGMGLGSFIVNILD